MTDEQKFAKAVSKLNAEFVESNQDERIKKPMAKALYETWKWFDENEKERNVKG